MDTKREALAQAKEYIFESELIPAELKQPLSERANDFVESWLDWPPVDTRLTVSSFYPTVRGGELGVQRFAVKNDYLKIVEWLGGAALVIATALAVSATAPAVTAVALITSVAVISDRFRHKKANLDETQYKVILTLKAYGPITADNLAGKLSGLHIFGPEVWSERRTRDALNTLKEVHLADGSVENLVNETTDGRWSVNGI